MILHGFYMIFGGVTSISGGTFEIQKNVQIQKNGSSKNFGHTIKKSYKNHIKSYKSHIRIYEKQIKSYKNNIKSYEKYIKTYENFILDPSGPNLEPHWRNLASSWLLPRCHQQAPSWSQVGTKMASYSLRG